MGSSKVQTAPKAEKYSFHHGALGEVIGRRRGEDVVQFRGIPYASIPGRFRQSILNKELPSQPFWATNPGYVEPILCILFLPYPILRLPYEDIHEY